MKITVFGPPLNNSGGIGTLFTYFKKEIPDNIQVTFIDTRSNFKNPIFSLFSLMIAILRVTVQKLFGQIDLAHLNMGSRGSALRKLFLALWIKKLLHVPTVLHLHDLRF